MNKIINTAKSILKTWLQQSQLLRKGRTFACSQVISAGLVLMALMLPSLTSASSASPVPSDLSNLIAYSVDYEMDKARAEKTVEHYGEPIREIVEDALENNDENPDRKSTAQNTYQRESPLNEVLPKKMGDSFSQKELSDMQRDDQSANQ